MRFRFPGCVAPALTLFVLIGCGGGNSTDSKPKTYPVKGRVVDQDGKPVTGTIEFRSDSAPALACRSPLDKDGCFNLVTLTENNERLNGAVAGTHTVTITLAPEDLSKQSIKTETVTLPDKLTVKEEDNNFPELKIKRPRP